MVEPFLHMQSVGYFFPFYGANPAWRGEFWNVSTDFLNFFYNVVKNQG